MLLGLDVNTGGDDILLGGRETEAADDNAERPPIGGPDTPIMPVFLAIRLAKSGICAWFLVFGA